MLLANFNRKEHLRHRAVSLRQHGFLVILRFEKMQLEKVDGLKGLKALQPKKWEGLSLAAL